MSRIEQTCSNVIDGFKFFKRREKKLLKDSRANITLIEVLKKYLQERSLSHQIEVLQNFVNLLFLVMFSASTYIEFNILWVYVNALVSTMLTMMTFLLYVLKGWKEITKVILIFDILIHIFMMCYYILDIFLYSVTYNGEYSIYVLLGHVKYVGILSLFKILRGAPFIRSLFNFNMRSRTISNQIVTFCITITCTFLIISSLLIIINNEFGIVVNPIKLHYTMYVLLTLSQIGEVKDFGNNVISIDNWNVKNYSINVLMVVFQYFAFFYIVQSVGTIYYIIFGKGKIEILKTFSKFMKDHIIINVPSDLNNNKLNANEVVDFLREILDVKKNGFARFERVYVLVENEDALKVVKEKVNHSYFNEITRVCIGNVTDFAYLDSLNIGSCQGVFLLPDKHSDDSQLERVLALRSYDKNVLIHCIILNTEQRFLFLQAGASSIICKNDLRVKVMGKSLLCPGFSQLISNLLSTVTIKYNRNKNANGMLKEYIHGANQHIYEVDFAPIFIGKEFPCVNDFIYKNIKAICLLGIVRKGRTKINPNTLIIEQHDKAIVMAKNLFHAIRVSIFIPKSVRKSKIVPMASTLSVKPNLKHQNSKGETIIEIEIEKEREKSRIKKSFVEVFSPVKSNQKREFEKKKKKKIKKKKKKKDYIIDTIEKYTNDLKITQQQKNDNVNEKKVLIQKAPTIKPLEKKNELNEKKVPLKTPKSSRKTKKKHLSSRTKVKKSKPHKGPGFKTPSRRKKSNPSKKSPKIAKSILKSKIKNEVNDIVEMIKKNDESIEKEKEITEINTNETVLETPKIVPSITQMKSEFSAMFQELIKTNMEKQKVEENLRKSDKYVEEKDNKMMKLEDIEIIIKDILPLSNLKRFYYHMNKLNEVFDPDRLKTFYRSSFFKNFNVLDVKKNKYGLKYVHELKKNFVSLKDFKISYSKLSKLKNHLIITGNVSREIFNISNIAFSLRSSCIPKEKLRTIVFLSDDHNICKELYNKLKFFQNIFFYSGSATDLLDLKAVRLNECYGMLYVLQNKNDLESIKSTITMNALRKIMFYCVEINNKKNVKFFANFQNEEFLNERNYIEDSYHINKKFELSCLLSSQMISGKVFMSTNFSLLLMAQSFYCKSIIDVIECLCGFNERLEASEAIWMIDVKKEFINVPYSIVYEFYLLMKGAIVIGLYRVKDDKEIINDDLNISKKKNIQKSKYKTKIEVLEEKEKENKNKSSKRKFRKNIITTNKFGYSMRSPDPLNCKSSRMKERKSNNKPNTPNFRKSLRKNQTPQKSKNKKVNEKKKKEYFVFTNPPKDTVVKKDDLLYIIGDYSTLISENAPTYFKNRRITQREIRLQFVKNKNLKISNSYEYMNEVQK